MQWCSIPAILLVESVDLNELDNYTYMGDEVTMRHSLHPKIARRRSASGTN